MVKPDDLNIILSTVWDQIRIPIDPKTIQTHNSLPMVSDPGVDKLKIISPQKYNSALITPDDY